MEGENSRQKQGPKKKTKADFSDDMKKSNFPLLFRLWSFLPPYYPFFFHFGVTLNINKENVNLTFHQCRITRCERLRCRHFIGLRHSTFKVAVAFDTDSFSRNDTRSFSVYGF